MIDVILKRFEHPDEVRSFDLGTFELVTLGGMTIGRASHQPGWRWFAPATPNANGAPSREPRPVTRR